MHVELVDTNRRLSVHRQSHHADDLQAARALAGKHQIAVRREATVSEQGAPPSSCCGGRPGLGALAAQPHRTREVVQQKVKTETRVGQFTNTAVSMRWCGSTVNKHPECKQTNYSGFTAPGEVKQHLRRDRLAVDTCARNIPPGLTGHCCGAAGARWVGRVLMYHDLV